MHPNAISRMETGTTSPSLSTLASVAEALGVSPGALLDRRRQAAEGSGSPASDDAGDLWQELTQTQRDAVIQVMRVMREGG